MLIDRCHVDWQAVSKERRCQEEKYSERVATLTTQQEKSLDELRTKLVAEKQVGPWGGGRGEGRRYEGR